MNATATKRKSVPASPVHSEEDDYRDEYLDEQYEGDGETHYFSAEDEEQTLEAQEMDTCSPLEAGAQMALQPSRMLLRRSMSPDGFIDSVSVEIELGVEGLSAGDIKTRGLKALMLEAEIAQGYLGSLPTKSKLPLQRRSQNRSHNGVAGNGGLGIPARLLDIGMTRNNNYFINVRIGKRTAKLFGNAYQLVAKLAKAGQDLTPDAISEGLRLNFPCRALTKPSDDGRYLNVVDLYPAA
ncbi:MAG: hypothetical protein JST85_30540 [Acidobacteria bacterium]|nr:hypothetical protein [Acidobacteriota bacterium]